LPTKTTTRNGQKAVTAAVAKTAEIQISRIASETLRVPIIGTSELIQHQWGVKARQQMLDNMQGRKTPKQPKNPEAEYEAAMYRLPDNGYGHPASAFKLATVEASRLYGKDVTKVGLLQFIFFFGENRGELVRINGEPRMREDTVRVGRGGADLRYRPGFPEWSAVLEVRYVSSVLTRDSVLSLIDAAGLTVGVGEWRPEKKGSFGTFMIDQDKPVEVVP
jgi:hypothetical protein